MLDFEKIEEKWRKKWDTAKLFEADASPGTKKFFCTFPYPYVNAFPHIGHLYTIMRVEALARYKRATGHHVLFPQGWHATGSPIVSAAKRVKEREEKQVKIMGDMGISGKELKKFEDPAYWITYFIPEAKKDYHLMGLSIDWRRQFHTTDLNPYYDRFVRWQFRKLQEKGHVVKGKFPVVWDPVENCAIGDHDRSVGEGETPKDFAWIKFRLKDSDLILMTGTTRPDALLGQTNLWVDPGAVYQIVSVNGEKWVVGKKAVEKIEKQFGKAKVIGTITSAELIGQWVQGPIVDYPLYILPAWFIDANVGSGLVYSALEDPVDLLELHKIQSDTKIIEKYGLDQGVVKKLKPIFIIDVPNMGENLGEDIAQEFGVKSAKDKKNLELAKGELNRRVYRKGVMKKNCGKYSGMTVEDAQVEIKKDLLSTEESVMFYELTGRVVSRFLNECVVKIVEDQWFMNYSDKKWKEITHKCLKKVRLYPEKSRNQFEYVIDWLHNWACTREEGLGTRLPWDEKWLIESLSDSTVYMAYYTITHLLVNEKIDDVDDTLFDYVFLGKGKAQNKNWDVMQKEFTYWYPLDFRNSGKDLVQNHLTFFLFHHNSIFPEKYWPKGIGVNGWVTVDGQKMSKSLGNMIPLRDMPKQFCVDAARFTILSGGEGLDDPNWDSAFATAFKQKLSSYYDYCLEWYGKGCTEMRTIDKWMLSQLHEGIQGATGFMEETLFRSANQKIFFSIHNAMKWYMRRTKENPNTKVVQEVIEAQLVMLSVFCPFVCEEIWEKLGKKGFVSSAKWPSFDKKKVDITLDVSEKTVEKTLSDIQAVLKLAKVSSPKKITVFVSLPWKYALFKDARKMMEKTRNPKEVLGKVLTKKDFKTHSKEISAFLPKLVATGKIPEVILNQKEEVAILEENKTFFETEFKCSVVIVPADSSEEKKALQAMPGKVALLVE
jgi:leucyl-tRNA synthetase